MKTKTNDAKSSVIEMGRVSRETRGNRPGTIDALGGQQVGLSND